MKFNFNEIKELSVGTSDQEGRLFYKRPPKTLYDVGKYCVQYTAYRDVESVRESGVR